RRRHTRFSRDWSSDVCSSDLRKFDTARTLVPGAEIDEVSGTRLAIVAYGSTRYAIDEARDELAARGVGTSFMRIRALPIGDEVRDRKSVVSGKRGDQCEHTRD